MVNRVMHQSLFKIDLHVKIRTVKMVNNLNSWSLVVTFARMYNLTTDFINIFAHLHVQVYCKSLYTAKA